MNRWKSTRRLVRRYGHVEIAKRIEWNCCADEVPRGWIKDRIRSVQDALEPVNRNERAVFSIFDLAIAKSTIVTPASIKQFIAFDSERGEKGVYVTVDLAITKLGKTRAATAGDNLPKWVEWIECVNRKPRFGERRRIWRRDTSRQGGIGWNGDRLLTFGLEVTRS